jgi:MYXO-CTERM domain-containing protein
MRALIAALLVLVGAISYPPPDLAARTDGNMPGCACAITNPAPPPLGMLALFALALLARRRRATRR